MESSEKHSSNCIFSFRFENLISWTKGLSGLHFRALLMSLKFAFIPITIFRTAVTCCEYKYGYSSNYYWYGDGDSAWSQDTLFVIWAFVETPGHNAVTINWWLNLPPPQQEGPFGYYWENGRAGYIWCDHVSDGASSSLSLSHVTRAGQMALSREWLARSETNYTNWLQHYHR